MDGKRQTLKCELGYFDSYRENDGGCVAWVTDRIPLETVTVTAERGHILKIEPDSQTGAGLSWIETKYGWEGRDRDGRKLQYLDVL